MENDLIAVLSVKPVHLRQRAAAGQTCHGSCGLRPVCGNKRGGQMQRVKTAGNQLSAVVVIHAMASEKDPIFIGGFFADFADGDAAAAFVFV